MTKPAQLDLPATTEPTWGSQVARLIMRAKVDYNRKGMSFTVGDMAEIIDAAYDALPIAGKKRCKVTERDPIFDAIAEACGIAPPFTRGAARTIATAKRDILEAEPGASPAEIHRRAKLLRAKYAAPFGPMGLAKHWAAFHPAKVTHAPEGPSGWLARLNELFPDCAYAKSGAYPVTEESPYAWARIPEYLREKLK